jgi:hypothetical protein
VWGRRYLLTVVENDAKPSVKLDHRRITLTVRPGSSLAKRSEVIREWQTSLLHLAIPPLIEKWEKKSLKATKTWPKAVPVSAKPLPVSVPTTHTKNDT